MPQMSDRASLLRWPWLHPRYDEGGHGDLYSQPSENANCMAFDARPDMLREPFTRRIPDFGSRKHSLKPLVGAHIIIERVKFVVRWFDEHVDVGIRTCFIARVRTKQIKRPDPMRTQRRLDGSQLGDNVGAIHIRSLAHGRMRVSPGLHAQVPMNQC